MSARDRRPFAFLEHLVGLTSTVFYALHTLLASDRAKVAFPSLAACCVRGSLLDPLGLALSLVTPANFKEPRGS